MNEPLSILLDNLSLRKVYEESVGILEYEGGLPREFAEHLALLNVIGRHLWH